MIVTRGRLLLDLCAALPASRGALWCPTVVPPALRLGVVCVEAPGAGGWGACHAGTQPLLCLRPPLWWCRGGPAPGAWSTVAGGTRVTLGFLARVAEVVIAGCHPFKVDGHDRQLGGRGG
jgi:hypothetical protein